MHPSPDMHQGVQRQGEHLAPVQSFISSMLTTKFLCAKPGARHGGHKDGKRFFGSQQGYGFTFGPELKTLMSLKMLGAGECQSGRAERKQSRDARLRCCSGVQTGAVLCKPVYPSGDRGCKEGGPN